MNRYLGKALSLGGQLTKYFCVAHCTFTYVGNLVLCTGPSMEPTLYTDDVLMTDCITPRLNKIDTGDIIIARLPSKPQTLICKRVVGLPGDRIIWSNPNEYHKHKSINVTQLREENERITAKEAQRLADKFKVKFNMKEVFVPPGHVWIEGDNSDNSGDSRHYGAIPQGLIQSRVIARIWPPGDCRLFLKSFSKPFTDVFRP